MKIALYIVCWFAVIFGLIGTLTSTNLNDAIVGSIFYIPALFSLVYLTTHK
jgi:hypothetical protein